MNKEEQVNHPKHYNSHPSGIECIDVVKHFNFNIGNVIKYVWRSAHKGVTVQDLHKAIWYLANEIERLTGEPYKSRYESKLDGKTTNQS